ncbi:MAG TPA: helix-turn-helix transcriptional regulator [Candidatus Binataceae bacterium]|nr:helix-turn-helix transcriptional regulator [Candidatus Binataceae bacterium]
MPTSDHPVPTRFGRYLRQKRVAAGRSLREVASALGLSHVYLGEVERGVRGPLRPEHWVALLKAVPELTREELEWQAAVSRPVEMDIADAPPHYQDLAMALARRLKNRDLTQSEISRLLKVLKARDGQDDE